MSQSPHCLRNDLKCVECDVKRYYTHTHTDEAYFSGGFTSVVVLFTDACWTAAEVSPNKVEWLRSFLGIDINVCVPGELLLLWTPRHLADVTAARITP